MSNEPNRRRGRVADELRAHREELKRQWDKDHPTAMPMVEPPIGVPDSRIAARAYELYERRGRKHGHDVDDWLRAERELLRLLNSIVL
jgi:hypothetical protein